MTENKFDVAIIGAGPGGTVSDRLGARLGGEATTRYGARFDCDAADLIQGYVYFFGVWEPDITAFLDRSLRPVIPAAS